MLLWSVNAELLKLDGLLFGRKSEITHLACPSASITGASEAINYPMIIYNIITHCHYNWTLSTEGQWEDA